MSREKTVKINVPETMSAIRQHSAGGKLVYESIPVPQPGDGEVLVRMHASPVNPSDLALIQGNYLARNFPFTPGLEGSGVVVSSGGGLIPGFRVGKRVACSPDPKGDGTWAEYMKTSAMRTIPLPREISFEQGAMMLVNPMTTMAFLQLVKSGNHQAFVNNAAASALGKMLIRVAIQNKIPLINIVRKEEQVILLKKLGATHVLNSDDDNFEEELRRLSHDLKATLLLDAVTGKQSSLLLRAAPRGATLVSYARLSGDSMTVDPGDLIKEEKQIIGFQLGNWLHTKGLFFKLRFISQVKKRLPDSLNTHINQRMPLAEVEKAISHYKKHMSDGKIVLTIGKSTDANPT